MHIFRKDNFLIGALLGLILPILAYGLTRWTDLATLIGNKPLSLYVIAALINLLLVRYFYRQGHENTARGVIMMTFVGVLALIFGQGLRI